MSDGAFLAGNLLLFGRVLRAVGLDVHHARLLDAVRSLEWAGVRSRTDVAAALRCLLVHRQGDLARFDAAFALFFREHRPPAPGLPLFAPGERPRVIATPAPGSTLRVEIDDVQPGAAATRRAVGAWSAAGVLRTRSFANFTGADLERARLLLRDLPWSLSVRRTRRWQRAARGAVDLRPLLRWNLTRGGDLVELPRRQRATGVRPIVVIADVSGSMERYSHVLLSFVYGLAHSAARVEAFLFATQLTRVTRPLIDQRGAAVFTRVAREVRDWGGGTRIGEALRTFNLRWARRVIRNGPVVLIVSDGWDRGDPALLGRELARIRRSCRRLIWLNPLLGSAGYEPLARGMHEALRHVDDLLPVRNLANLEELANHLRRLPGRSKPVGWKPGRGSRFRRKANDESRGHLYV